MHTHKAPRDMIATITAPDDHATLRSSGLALGGDGGVDGTACCQEIPAWAQDVVVEPDAHRGEPRGPGMDLHHVVVARGSAILARRLDDGELRALGLHVAIALARLPEPVGPPDLEPHQVVGVVDHAHDVGFGVPHPEGRRRDER